MTRRNEQIASLIQRAVQQILARGLSDPRIEGLITVTGVEVSPDFATAVISVSIYPQEKEELSMHGLRAAETFVRREAGEIIETHKLPQFIFKLDRSLKKQAAVLSTLSDIARTRDQNTPDGATDAPPGSPEEKPS